MLPIPIIHPFLLSSKITILPSFTSRVTNYDLSSVICFEQPLSRYQSLFLPLAVRHNYKKESSRDFRYLSHLGSFRISRNGSFRNPHLFNSLSIYKIIVIEFVSSFITTEISKVIWRKRWFFHKKILQKFLFLLRLKSKSNFIKNSFLVT